MKNLLFNGDFGDDYYLWRGDEQIIVAAGWTPWWMPQTGGDPVWKNRKPEYRQAALATDPLRVRSGASSQQYSSFWGTHTAGLWQQVIVEPEARLRFSAWGHAWSSEDDQPRPSRNPTHVHMSVGVDPLGGTDPTSSAVIWSSEQNAIDNWRLLAVDAQARTYIITVFVRSAPEWPKKHQDIFWDDAALEVLEVGRPGGIASGGDRRTELLILPQAPEPGVETTAVIRSQLNYGDTSLIVRDPELQVLPISGPTLAREGNHYLWEYRFRPEVSGVHTIAFGSDAGSRVIRWAQVPVGSESPAAVSPPRGPHPASAVQTTHTTSVSRGAPRIQYRRTYVLLPPTADSTWAKAAIGGGFDARRTVGFSADDAGIGALDERSVIAVNPHHWLNELTADWFEENYPGVKFYALIVQTPEELSKALRHWRD